jgi:hypothetical protein
VLDNRGAVEQYVQPLTATFLKPQLAAGFESPARPHYSIQSCQPLNIFAMKNAILLLLLFALACGKNDDCADGKSIDSVQPNSNPAGYEVVILTDGFTSAATVRFGQSVASSRAGAEGEQIIARVPSGLSGNVQITVEEGDCVARYDDFTVLGSFPSNSQPGLPDIVIPNPGNPPATGIGNVYYNYADTTSAFILQAFDDQPGVLDTFSFELLATGATNPIRGTFDLAANEIFIEVDRRATGGEVEAFEGEFIAQPPGLPAKKYWLLLVSQNTGRQLLLYRLFD